MHENFLLIFFETKQWMEQQEKSQTHTKLWDIFNLNESLTSVESVVVVIIIVIIQLGDSVLVLHTILLFVFEMHCTLFTVRRSLVELVCWQLCSPLTFALVHVKRQKAENAYSHLVLTEATCLLDTKNKKK